MILNGNQRGGAKDLALHLMKTANECVEIHELRGFMSSDLMGAFIVLSLFIYHHLMMNEK